MFHLLSANYPILTLLFSLLRFDLLYVSSQDKHCNAFVKPLFLWKGLLRNLFLCLSLSLLLSPCTHMCLCVCVCVLCVCAVC